LSSRNVESLDLEALFFFINWYFELHPDAKTFKIRDVFPGFPKRITQMQFLKPGNWNQQELR